LLSLVCMISSYEWVVRTSNIARTFLFFAPGYKQKACQMQRQKWQHYVFMEHIAWLWA
jgi:hypothetical protein